MFDTHTAQKVACRDVNAWSTGDDASSSLVPHTADETVALHLDIDIGRNQQFHAAQVDVDVNLLILADCCLAQIQAQTATEGIQAGAVERFAPIGVLIGTKTDSAADALAILALRHWPLKPLRRVVTITVNNEFCTDIKKQNRAKIFRP